MENIPIMRGPSAWHFCRIEFKQKKLNPIIILIRLLIALCSPTLVYIAVPPFESGLSRSFPCDLMLKLEE